MDYLFIHYFNTGVKGAAMATFSGYLIALLWFIMLLVGKKVSVPFGRISLKDVVYVRRAAGRGVAMSLNQLGYAVKTFFGNSLAMALAGIEGVTIFTLCMQSIGTCDHHPGKPLYRVAFRRKVQWNTPCRDRRREHACL